MYLMKIKILIESIILAKSGEYIYINIYYLFEYISVYKHSYVFCKIDLDIFLMLIFVTRYMEKSLTL